VYTGVGEKMLYSDEIESYEENFIRGVYNSPEINLSAPVY
jgi:hypothetical protein